MHSSAATKRGRDHVYVFVLVEPDIAPHLVLQLFEHECHGLAVEVS